MLASPSGSSHQASVRSSKSFVVITSGGRGTWPWAGAPAEAASGSERRAYLLTRRRPCTGATFFSSRPSSDPLACELPVVLLHRQRTRTIVINAIV